MTGRIFFLVLHACTHISGLRHVTQWQVGETSAKDWVTGSNTKQEQGRPHSVMQNAAECMEEAKKPRNQSLQCSKFFCITTNARHADVRGTANGRHSAGAIRTV